ncbi:DinB family protein [Indiicoccus explosivorum]|uniref:DinB family protein n=1 Tax=Indiicoccus explosivorum TaxID=1917864 RepID=UPI00138FE6C0|nr:DinB family protein [Indiicoccus explosivorum]
MDKAHILEEKRKTAEWAESLKALSEEQWFRPFREGTWGTADVISHFIAWDKFIIENRIAYLLRDDDLPKVKVDVEEVNRHAREHARSGISKEDLIDEFVAVREALVSFIDKIPEERFAQPYPGNPDFTLLDYFTGMVEHDRKHQKEIDGLIVHKQDPA